MAIAEAAKIVFQTALAGTLESKGFKRFSDTNYVIEGDGVEWRVVFGPEYKDDPGTFREATGIFLPEIDVLFQQAFPDDGLASRSMAGTKFREHYFRTIDSGYQWQDPKKGLPKLEEIEHCHVPYDKMFGRREHWKTKGEDLVSLGARVNSYWCKYVWPWLELRMERNSICNGSSFSTLSPEEISLDQAIGFWVCGHKEIVQQSLAIVIEKHQYSDRQIEDLLIARHKEEHGKSWFSTYRPSKNEIDRFRRSYTFLAADARSIARTLGINL